MDSNDPEERIRELERQLTDAEGGPRENVPGRYEVRPPQASGMMPPPPPPGVNPPNYELLHRQMDRRRRFSSTWLVFLVPGIFLLAVLVFHPHRVETHSTPSTSWPGTEPTADPSNALTVGPGGNLTVGPSSETLALVCNHGDLTVDGNTNLVNVTGHCAHLTVRGSHNKVIADAADTIYTDGSANLVVYHTGAPQIAVGGWENTVTRG
jgi:Protein of unknown function (DUF3060)